MLFRHFEESYETDKNQTHRQDHHLHSDRRDRSRRCFISFMRSGIDSVDRGQREAAIALGFTERQAFFDFIFPQAAVTFLPVYRGELVTLLKGTSIVGYISILDLTKMSDIIRSRTYEAFFPLIATALIYFALAWVISVLMSALLSRVDWKSEKNIAKRMAGKRYPIFRR